jgi:hypothetical protein
MDLRRSESFVGSILGPPTFDPGRRLSFWYCSSVGSSHIPPRPFLTGRDHCNSMEGAKSPSQTLCEADYVR